MNDKKAKLKIKRVNSKLGTKTAYGGEAVEFDVDGADINVGDVICNRDRPVKIEEKFTAKFMLLENIAVSEKPKMKLHMNGAIHDAYIDGIQRVENPTDGNLSKTVFYPYRGECFIGRLQCDGKFYYEHHKEFYKFAKFVITEGKQDNGSRNHIAYKHGRMGSSKPAIIFTYEFAGHKCMKISSCTK